LTSRSCGGWDPLLRKYAERRMQIGSATRRRIRRRYLETINVSIWNMGIVQH
jgi:hypothetical protein